MDLVHLRSFTEVAERGTIAAAAAAQSYTPPAVSQQLAKLETAIGEPLFDRVGGRLSLTGAGRALLPLAFEMLDLEASARTRLSRRHQQQRVVFTGFASAIATVLIPRLEALNDVASIEIIEAEDHEALRDLSLGAVDIVLTQEYDGFPVERNRRFTYTPLVSDRLVLVLPPTMPTSTRLEDLTNASWLVNGQGTRCTAATDHVLDVAGIEPRIVGTVADNSTLLALVAADQGVTVVPSRVITDNPSVSVGEQDLGMKRTILAVTRTALLPRLAPVLDLLTDPNHTDPNHAGGTVTCRQSDK